MRISAKRLEAILRESGVPYVSVDEAKKALFTGAQLRSFHFVVYSAVGDNWLVTCRPFAADMRQTMEHWQEIFGQGFLSVEARVRRGRVVFIGLDGRTIEPGFADANRKGGVNEEKGVG